jgi:hypothetical protein
MAPKLSLEARMTIIELLRRGWSRMAIAETLGVTEGSVRYHERRRREGSSDGRVGRQQHRLAVLATEVEARLSADAGRRQRLNLAALYDYLVAETATTAACGRCNVTSGPSTHHRGCARGAGSRRRPAPRARPTGRVSRAWS